MSVHKWSIRAPTWYVLDQFPERASKVFGSAWSTKKARFSCCFIDENGMPLKMAFRYENVSVPCGEIYSLLTRARNEQVEEVFLVFDAPAYTPLDITLDKKENVV